MKKNNAIALTKSSNSEVMNKYLIASEFGIKLFDELIAQQRFAEQLLKSESEHTIQMLKAEAVKGYRDSNIENLSKEEKYLLTEAFCKTILNE